MKECSITQYKDATLEYLYSQIEEGSSTFRAGGSKRSIAISYGTEATQNADEHEQPSIHIDEAGQVYRGRADRPANAAGQEGDFMKEQRRYPNISLLSRLSDPRSRMV